MPHARTDAYRFEIAWSIVVVVRYRVLESSHFAYAIAVEQARSELMRVEAGNLP
jgi:hypothetical protein